MADWTFLPSIGQFYNFNYEWCQHNKNILCFIVNKTLLNKCAHNMCKHKGKEYKSAGNS